MLLKDFLKEAQDKFRERGTTHMVQVLDQLIAQDIGLDQAVEQCKQKMQTFEKYSLDFQYYWSQLTYLESLRNCYTAAHV